MRIEVEKIRVKKQAEDKTGLWRGGSREALLGFLRLKCVKYVAPYPNVFSHILLNTICISRLSLKVSTQNQKLFEMCFVFAILDWKTTMGTNGVDWIHLF